MLPRRSRVVRRFRLMTDPRCSWLPPVPVDGCASGHSMRNAGHVSQEIHRTSQTKLRYARPDNPIFIIMQVIGLGLCRSSCNY